MEATRFDAITKAVWGMPRRRVLGGVAAGALSALLGHGVRAANAALLTCKRTRNCPQGNVCIHKACVPKCPNPSTCGNSDVSNCPIGCFCVKKPGGGHVCAQAGGLCTTQPCTRQRDCSQGEVCATPCCPEGFPKFVCLPACDA